MEMVRNEIGQSCWSSQATIETIFGAVNEKGWFYRVIGRKQLASYFSSDFQTLKVKGLLFTEENQSEFSLRKNVLDKTTWMKSEKRAKYYL